MDSSPGKSAVTEYLCFGKYSHLVEELGTQATLAATHSGTAAMFSQFGTWAVACDYSNLLGLQN